MLTQWRIEWVDVCELPTLLAICQNQRRNAHFGSSGFGIDVSAEGGVPTLKRVLFGKALTNLNALKKRAPSGIDGVRILRILLPEEVDVLRVADAEITKFLQSFWF